MTKRSLGAWCALVAICVAMIGCPGGAGEEPRVTVKGTVTRDGQPLPLDPAMAAAKAARVEVGFLRETGGEDQSDFGATVDAEPDGSFEIEVPPGKYRIGVRYFDGQSQGDALQGKFDERNSPIIREITSETTDLKIELADPQG